MERGIQKGVKHSLSSSDRLHPVKKGNHDINDPEHVRESTEIIFRLLLKDIGESERVISEVPDDEDETGSLKKQDSFGLDLDLPTDIQSDGIADKEEDNQEATFKKIAHRLSEIGDEFQKIYEVKDDFQQSLISYAQKAVTESAYPKFEESLDTFLENQKNYLPDSGEQYQVALVLLCTKTALKMANKPITAANNNADILISNAVNFVSTHFPRWLGGIQ